MAVRDRRLVRTLQFDPVVVRLLAEHEPFQRFMERMYHVLLSDAGLDGRIEAAMFFGAISTAVMHPLVADIDDDTLLARVIEVSRRLLRRRGWPNENSELTCRRGSSSSFRRAQNR